MYNAAEQALHRDELQKAFEYADAAEHAPRTAKDRPDPIRLALLRTEILLAQGRNAEAAGVLDKLQIDKLQSAGLKARALADQAELRLETGKTDAVGPLLDQAFALASSAPDDAILASIELKRGRLLRDDFDEADAAFRRAVSISERRHDPFIAAQAMGNMGYIRMARFRYDEAIPWFEAADESAQKIPSKVVHEKNLGNLGWCYFRLGKSDRALDLLARAIPLAAEVHNSTDQQLWLGNMGSIYYARQEYDKAISHYLQALEIARRKENQVNSSWWLSNIARAYRELKNWDEAEKYNAMASATKPGDEVLAYLEVNAGLLATARGRDGEAESAFQKAIALGDKTHQPNVEWQAHSGLGELYRSRRPEKAEKAYATAVNVLDNKWLEWSRDESRFTFRNDQTSFYQDYVDLVAQEGHKAKALEIAEGSRARLLMQKLDGRAAALPAFRAENAVRLARETGSLFLFYWLAKSPGASPSTADQSYLWAISGDGVTQFVLPSESVINALVERHRRSIENLEDPLSSGSNAGRQLFQILLGPAQPLLQHASRVIIVPDGRLHEINFETLVVEKPAPHYWIEDATVALAPSLGVLRMQRTEKPRAAKLLMMGDPQPADPEYPPLPHLRAEMQEIEAGFPAASRAVYAGAEAYPQHFRQADPGAFTAIHFATHATANEESPLNSAIILSPHDGQYKLYASDIADLKLDPELVTISACRSAGAKSYSGEGLIGFSWAFLNAGARNVVGGIWNVDDAAAPPLMKEFYQEWRTGHDPATALRDAKLHLMRMGGAFRKPYYWGPFEVFTRQATRSAIDLAWRNSSK